MSEVESRFELERRSRTTETWNEWAHIANIQPNDDEQYNERYQDNAINVATGYQYRIRACNEAGCSAFTTASAEIFIPLPAPYMPRNVTASAVSPNQINVSWTDVSNESRYEMERKSLVAGMWSSWEPLGSFSSNATTAASTGLVGGGTYEHRIRACNDTGCSGYGSTGPTTTPSDGSPVPAAPVNPNATRISGYEIDVGWTDVSTDESIFQVRRRTRGGDGVWGAWVTIQSLPANSTLYRNANLVPATTYQYGARTCNPIGCSIWVTTGQVTTYAPPPVPSHISVVAVSSVQIDVSWGVPNSGESRFELERRVLVGTVWSAWTLIASPAAAVGSLSDSGRAAGKSYQYRIRSCSSFACSAYITSASVTTDPPPAFPENITATPVAGWRIDLSWSNVSTEEVYFKLQRRTRGGDGAWSAYQTLGTVPGNSTTYIDSTLTTATTYEYRIRSCNTESCSTWVASAQVTTPDTPPEPTGFSAIAVSPTQIALTWTDTSAKETLFAIGRQRNESGTWSKWENVGGPGQDSTSFSDTTVVAGTTYHYRIRACNAAGCSRFVFSSDIATPD